MESVRKLPWLRISAEAVAIVVSILLAFSIEAWWQERSELEQERELLQALLDDFTATKEEIQDWRKFHLEVELSTKALLEGALSNDTQIPARDVRQLISNLTWFDSESYFATGALNSLVNGGDLSRVRNTTLRRLIADWPSRILTAEAIQRQDYEFFTQVLTPFLRTNTRLPLLAAESAARPGDSNTVFPKLETDIGEESELIQLLAIPEFQNILYQKTWIQFDILGQIDETEALLDETISLLNRELDGT